jgi:hypothetical protein
MSNRNPEREDQQGSQRLHGAWDVMTVIAGFAALGGFASAARSPALDWLQIIICVLFAITIGALLVWIIRFLGFWLARIILRNHIVGSTMKKRTTFALGLLHLLAFVWIPVSAILASQIAAQLVELFH